MVEEKYKHQHRLFSFEQSLALLKKERRAYYKKLKPIKCPILDGELVYFTAQGFDHLINESNSKQGDSKARDPHEQYLKLMHLGYAPEIIKNCERISQVRPVRKYVKGRWKNGKLYELACDVEVGKVAVIIEKLGEGNYKFLSVKPLYRRANYERKKQNRRTKKRPEGRS